MGAFGSPPGVTLVIYIGGVKRTLAEGRWGRVTLNVSIFVDLNFQGKINAFSKVWNNRD